MPASCFGGVNKKKGATDSILFQSPAPNLKEVDLSIALMLLINYIIRFLKLLGSGKKEGGIS